MEGNAQSSRKADQPLILPLFHVFIGGDGEGQRQLCRIGPADIFHHPGKHPFSGYALVGIFIRAVKGDLDQRGRMLHKEFYPFFIQ